MIALSIRRPWPWAILHLPREIAKDIENRDWPTSFRGKFLVHASKGCTKWDYTTGAICIEDAIEQLVPMETETCTTLQGLGFQELKDMPAGAIVGWAEITDCVETSNSPWFSGRYGFVLGRRGVLQPIPCKGQLGFFRVPEDVAQAVREQAIRG